MENTPIILILGFVLAFFYILLSFIRIVPEYERLVVLQLGRYAGTRGPGITHIIPFFEKAMKVDLRERFLEIPRQTAITKDNAPIAIDFLVYYRVVDPKLSVLQVDNVVRASLNIATTTLRAVIGDIPLDDVLAKRESINDVLRVKLDEITVRWGMKITSVEIREIDPPKDVQDAMNRQMTAERVRRATVTQASGEREAKIMVAEGEKQAAVLRAEANQQAAILQAEGEKQAAVLRAEGERQAQFLKAQGFAAGLQAIQAEAKDAAPNTMALQYFETLRAMGEGEATKFVLPMELTGMMQQFMLNLSQNSAAHVPESTNGKSRE